ncbi:MAG: MBL fold metallo-hydrolase [Bacteroidetes bacterium]|nr:MAG: MBL fold metallo-hydrolase [Bacteroidota bacterium]REK00010.1 MAG: MBL fold metallo-hydrolase [Bacteroidota bacterium]REK35811.1 MAG: MBL fold metallo-hydrolase [Bacteroidota bacterium]REK49318.1 MAG: MBL fold metallo-hydrolase [Bacteroidota bacterium]
MQLTFLGTGTSQGVPMIGCKCRVCQSDDPRNKRLRTSVLIQSESTSVVIDSGPDFRQQMLRENVNRLDAVLFTHEHKDHIAGLDDVRAYNYLTGKEMEIYATERVQEALRREFFYVFSGAKYPGIPRLNLQTISNKPFQIGDIPFIPIEVSHLNLPVLGFRIGDFTYITDANLIPDSEKEKIKGSRFIAINALRNEKHVSHFTRDEAVEIIREFNPERAFLIHISHQLGLHEKVNAELPENIECAYDGLQVEF